MRGRKGLTKTECFIALELTMCSPQAKKHVTMDCDGERRGRWREKGRSDRGLSIIGNQARYHLDRGEVLIVLLINKQTKKTRER